MTYIEPSNDGVVVDVSTLPLPISLTGKESAGLRRGYVLDIGKRAGWLQPGQGIVFDGDRAVSVVVGAGHLVIHQRDVLSVVRGVIRHWDCHNQCNPARATGCGSCRGWTGMFFEDDVRFADASATLDKMKACSIRANIGGIVYNCGNEAGHEPPCWFDVAKAAPVDLKYDARSVTG